MRARAVTMTAPDALWMYGYPGTCQIVFQHLLDNCLLHAFAGRSQGLISVTAELVEDAVLIRWQDDGCGIAEEHVASVFDPFYTTQLGQTGMGLGLASVHGMVVNLMKGQVSLESTPGQVRASCCACPYMETRQDARNKTARVGARLRVAAAGGHRSRSGAAAQTGGGRNGAICDVSRRAGTGCAGGAHARAGQTHGRTDGRGVLSLVARTGHRVLKPRTLILPVTRNDERETRYRWLVKLVRQRFVCGPARQP
jgi:hypothetical protein